MTGRDKKCAIEAGKTALIILLTVTAILLVGRLGVFGSSLEGGGDKFMENDGTYLAVAEPFAIVVTPGDATHLAVMYDADELKNMYERLSTSLGEALGSSGTPETVSEQAWKSALRGRGIYFDFYSPQPLAVVAEWLGTSISGGASEHNARRICISVSSNSVDLYYVSAVGGECYRCKTALSAPLLLDALQEYLPNGANYNFELESQFAGVDSYAVMLQGQPSVPSVAERLPLGNTISEEALLSIFSVNEYTANKYTETDGTTVYVEGGASLRVESGGRITYTAGERAEGGKKISTISAIETARRLCARTIGASSGDAEIYLEYVHGNDEAEAYTLRFEYKLNGLPIAFADGRAAAEIIIQGSDIVYAELTFKEYVSAEPNLYPLPSAQAAAVVRASGGGEPVLCYLDDFSKVSAEWMIK